MAQLRLAMIQAHSGLPSALPARSRAIRRQARPITGDAGSAQSVATARIGLLLPSDRAWGDVLEKALFWLG